MTDDVIARLVQRARLEIMYSSALANCACSPPRLPISRSRSRARSTARASRLVMTLRNAPTAVSMKTGAIANWITLAMLGTWVSMG